MPDLGSLFFHFLFISCLHYGLLMCEEDSGFKIRFVESWNVAEIVELYKAGGWWKQEYSIDGLSDLIAGSFLFVVIIEKSSKKAVGMGRMISDGVSDGYIQDVVVMHELRGKGLGKKIISSLVCEAQSKGLEWIGLIGEPNTQGFYEKLGFKLMKDHVPMLYSGKVEE